MVRVRPLLESQQNLNGYISKRDSRDFARARALARLQLGRDALERNLRTKKGTCFNNPPRLSKQCPEISKGTHSGASREGRRVGVDVLLVDLVREQHQLAAVTEAHDLLQRRARQRRARRVARVDDDQRARSRPARHLSIYLYTFYFSPLEKFLTFILFLDHFSF